MTLTDSEFHAVGESSSHHSNCICVHVLAIAAIYTGNAWHIIKKDVSCPDRQHFQYVSKTLDFNNEINIVPIY